MSLRLRLIVAFFFLAVVPLGAVTLYTYTSNVAAMQDAASHEAELLAGELTQRMEIVTAQLGQRVERLMNISSDTTQAAAPAPAPQVVATPARAGGAAGAATTAASAASNASLGSQQVAAGFEDLAMLLNNVELRGLRGRGRRGPSGDPNAPGGAGGGRGGFGSPPPGFPTRFVPAPTGAGAAPGVTPTPTPPSAAAAAAPATLATPAGTAPPAGSAAAPATSAAGASGGASAATGSRGGGGDPSRFGGPSSFDGQRFRGGGGPPPDGTSRASTPPDGSQGPRSFPPGTPRLGPPDAPAEDPNADPTRIRIDMGPIRDEIIRQFVPDGRLDQLTPEDRQRVMAEVNQRIFGIQQGIQMLQAKVAERAADAKALTATAAKPGAVAPAAPSAPAAPAPTPTAPTPPVAPKSASAATTGSATVAAPMQRRTAITGSRLDVSVEQNGEVVGQANAEINLPNLLSTVFTTTRRDRGEVPFAVGKDGHLYTPTEADKLKVEALGTAAARPETAPGTAVLPEWIVVTTADPNGSGLKFGIARPVGEALADLQRTTARNAGLGLGFIALMLVGIVPLSSRLTRDLSSLSDGVRRIAQGEYHARVEVRTQDEVGQLATAFNQMAADVEAHQRSMVGQERIRRELELGRQIQHDMLPHVPLRLGLTEIKGVSVPAREVGGDFFNYFQLVNGTVALLVGDVSGKGVGAALLMANIQASLRTRLALGQDLAALARELDRDIEGSTPGPVYATLFVGIFDPVTRLLRCVNAGHNPQYILRQIGGLERMESTGLPIGLLSGHGYAEQRIQLAVGDLLFFYTDGCVEAENAAGDMFGPERLEASLVAAAGASADLVLAQVEAEISKFRAGVDLSDDATMMAVKVG